MERIHAFVLVCFAALLGLFEGPAEIACVLVLLTTAATGRLRAYRWTWVEAGLLVWVASGLVGLLGAEQRPSSEDMFRPLLGLAFILGARGFKALPQSVLRKILVAFVGAMALNAAYGLLQFFVGELPLDKFLLANPRSPQVHIPNHYGLRTVSGLFYNRLKLAHMTIVVIGILLMVPMTFRARISKQMLIGSLLGALLLFLVVALTQARTALVATCIAVFTSALLLKRPKLIASLLVGSVVAGGLTVWMRFGIERLQLVFTDVGIRTKIYGIAIQLYQEHPWLGLGHGMYRTDACAIRQPDWAPSYLGDAHHLFLQVLVETGLIGFIGFTGAVILIMYRLLVRVYKHREESSEKIAMDRVALFVMVGYLSLGLFHFPLHHASVALAFWLFLGLAHSRYTQHLSKEPSEQQPSSPEVNSLAA